MILSSFFLFVCLLCGLHRTVSWTFLLWLFPDHIRESGCGQLHVLCFPCEALCPPQLAESAVTDIDHHCCFCWWPLERVPGPWFHPLLRGQWASGQELSPKTSLPWLCLGSAPCQLSDLGQISFYLRLSSLISKMGWYYPPYRLVEDTMS